MTICKSAIEKLAGVSIFKTPAIPTRKAKRKTADMEFQAGRLQGGVARFDESNLSYDLLEFRTKITKGLGPGRLQTDRYGSASRESLGRHHRQPRWVDCHRIGDRRVSLCFGKHPKNSWIAW